MDVYGTISAQLDAVSLPLFAVTLTAVPRRRTPLLLILHWHGFRREPDAARPPASRLEPVPSSALQLNEDWHALSELDHWMLDAAWRLGAWDLVRDVRSGCERIGAPEQEAVDCRQAFGDDPLRPPGVTAMVAEAPDREDLMRCAARVGYVRWSFRPVRGGVWRATATDDTLCANGGREPPCPVAAHPAIGAQRSQARFRLGRIERLIVPG